MPPKGCGGDAALKKWTPDAIVNQPHTFAVCKTPNAFANILFVRHNDMIGADRFDLTLVKRYAADFCGTEALRDASRDLVEAFISTLADEAAKDRAALICKLNSYNQLGRNRDHDSS